jgi:Uma2 family endonuclease
MGRISHFMSADALLQMPDDGYRYVLIRGELKRMSPGNGVHGILASRIGALIRQHVDAADLGEVFGAETGFKLESNPDTVLAPDGAFIKKDRLPKGKFPEVYWAMAPDLVIEIVSPGDRSSEVEEKVSLYLAAGVQSVWLFYPRTKTVTIRRSRSMLQLTEEELLADEEVLPGFRCPLEKLFKNLSV